ncbi:MAG TPA: hypoxanthine phosphoribosyltransferase [Actinomycetota bacterium]|nr:hypoxanthine phosphoribosyltransferase [Actinomycetota bacterium]
MQEGAELLYTAREIRDRVRELGAAITRDYAGREPVLVSVLKGSAVFLADLLLAIGVKARVDFMSISTYGSESQPSGVVRIMKDLDQDIGEEDVIVVEDIVDTGLTLSYLLSVLQARRPSSIEVCTLLDKSVRRITPLEIRYRGFDCPDRFVVGYGLDVGERYRNLPFILAVEDPTALAENPEALLPFLEDEPEP